MNDSLWIIPALPLAGFLLNGLLGRKLGPVFVSLLGPGVVGAAFVLSIMAFNRMLQAPGLTISQTLFTWIQSGNLNVPVTLLVDRLSGLYLLIITGIGFVIHLFAVGYMRGEAGFWRFFAYLNLFIFFMLILVMASSLLLLFVGWEGVGLCSYLLIGYYFEKDSAAAAAKKAFVVNRIGDFGFIVASLMLFWLFGTLEMAGINQQASVVLGAGSLMVTTVTLLLFVGAAGKSAQIPLYVWLPDAMEGPTPVSALIHAATMVTAGLYLLARMSHLFVLSPATLAVVAAVGAATALFSATIALAQNDIKRVLAYSTCSQLGYMFLAMGVGAFGAGVFHVMTHAFFKALLFLAAGSVITALHHEQDMRKMGGLAKKMPITGFTFLIGALAISGFPLIFSGFFSKDEILWQAFSSPAGSTLLWLVGLITAVLTAFYMFRAVGMAFFGASRLEHPEHVHESPWVMTLPLMILAFLSVTGGWLGIPHSLGGGLGITNRMEHYFEGFFAQVPAGAGHGDTGTELGLMALTTVLALGAMALGYRMFTVNRERALAWDQTDPMVWKVLRNKYYVDELYNLVVWRPLHWVSDKVLWKTVDVKGIDGTVNGAARAARGMGWVLRLAQNGMIEIYAVSMVAGAVLVVGYLVFLTE
ncbi:MAG: NADH-quinone oxidoreductase subunit L [Deltaproteobacteria bacterium]|nr:NADH-quinone oxidoreductase subunit L [Deltaproteobacteria bacterium]